MGTSIQLDDFLFQAIKEYRSQNRSSDKSPAGRGTKIECELCLDFFHPSHVQLPKPLNGKTSLGERDI
jgi:hypothetical protein